MTIKYAMTGVAILAFAAPAMAGDTGYSLLGEWPVKASLGSDWEVGLKGNLAYDYNRFEQDSLPGNAVEEDAWRRQELSLYLRKPGIFEASVGYDFKNEVWLDNYLKLSNERGGDLRIGQFKTPVGFEEGAVASNATTFLERSLAASMVYQGRRLGVDWTYERIPGWYFNAALMTGGDLQGDNDGRTLAARVVFNPIRSEDQVLHLGLAASTEKRDDDLARVRVRPEAFLTARRLVDSGALGNVEHIDRVGVEGLWQRGPWLAQGEYLRMDVQREGQPDYRADGYYLFGAWMLTGEQRSYKSAALGNVKPANAYGAVELALRYSRVDLNDGVLRGGRQSDWTFGANWYLGRHLKLQANYVRVDSQRLGVKADPDITEVRVQIYF
ncbi:OprO/OprP family phosphate-selective porin [Pseudomonas sp. CGJS7]|uniref:OprO/OprP family phosphate-selective porin n=1 Tax=Pseudomonas sp. CGJS7 TaxID=3109348 RepID=UPI0030098179